MSRLTNTYFLADYSCGTYSAGDYSGACTTSTTGGSSGNPINTLANTGFDILIPIFIGVALVFAGTIMLLKRWRRARKQASRFEAES